MNQEFQFLLLKLYCHCHLQIWGAAQPCMWRYCAQLHSHFHLARCAVPTDEAAFVHLTWNEFLIKSVTEKEVWQKHLDSRMEWKFIFLASDLWWQCVQLNNKSSNFHQLFWACCIVVFFTESCDWKLVSGYKSLDLFFSLNSSCFPSEPFCFCSCSLYKNEAILYGIKPWFLRHFHLQQTHLYLNWHHVGRICYCLFACVLKASDFHFMFSLKAHLGLCAHTKAHFQYHPQAHRTKTSQACQR